MAIADALRLRTHVKWTADRRWFWSDVEVSPELAYHLLVDSDDLPLRERPRNFAKDDYPSDMCAHISISVALHLCSSVSLQIFHSVYLRHCV